MGRRRKGGEGGEKERGESGPPQGFVEVTPLVGDSCPSPFLNFCLLKIFFVEFFGEKIHNFGLKCC